ncbi:BMP family ABC transporter substrate-binding protein [Paenibacillus psychroresistens]|uniref:BMP family ABC transporter substrate-binding protein n=1 Tax=Paenibacillus psychroresistens TaxID=1778678 RepID=A0A6B8RK11_9BACL|nr:BMP family ABC transporter substrate-binding protein [Paenibacillus psychroresistens]QGQ95688.1 BMP family ABC transporter substrate-binding protein [Paenibacillus psychroresistens]
MKKMLSLSLMLVLMFAVVLSACGKTKEENGASIAPSTAAATDAPAVTEAPVTSAAPVATEAPAAKFKVGMVTDIGGVNDNSFNQSAWEGLQQYGTESGTEVKYLQSKGDADYLTNLNTFAKDNYNLTWGIGFLMGDAIKAVADQNPKLNFAIIDNVVEAPNVESVTFSENEGAYLVGVIAGLTTETNKIGFVGGIKIPVITRFEAGFVAGVAAVNPDAKVSVNYTGAFDKPDLGKAAAKTLYDAGADIVFPAAGSTGNGVFNEAKDRLKKKKVWVIGVDKDQSLTFGDDITLTSMVKRVDKAVALISKNVVEGKFQGGKVTVLGLKEDGVGIPATSSKNVSADILAKVEEFKAKIISGEIKVPSEVK